ncbi:hypothetical protein TrVE_jg11373 [Triparma verrucosa]|nr:hypothetical protein TrST_g3775 [Triparma strigata]GMH83602.1 hypothetical protein TrVE_jg11373 [Triparma verrucosa]
MIVDEDESAWNRMQSRLKEAPIIASVLEAAGKISNASGVKKVRNTVGDIGEDAREAWETSQNPWVYRISSVWDTIMAEDEFAIGIRELRRLDPSFDLETWRSSVETSLAPSLLIDYMRGDLKVLKTYTGEAVYNKLAAEVRERKKEGIIFDDNVLGIEHCDVHACQLDPNDKGSPIIVLGFQAQQINCIRKKVSSKLEIIEGAEDDIKLNYYMVAWQRIFDEEDGCLKWKVVDLQYQQIGDYI